MNGGNLAGAIRGPVMLITLGALLALDQFGPYGFSRTWPALIIVFGVMKLLERIAARPAGYPPAYPPAGPPAPGGMA